MDRIRILRALAWVLFVLLLMLIFLFYAIQSFNMPGEQDSFGSLVQKFFVTLFARGSLLARPVTSNAESTKDANKDRHKQQAL